MSMQELKKKNSVETQDFASLFTYVRMVLIALSAALLYSCATESAPTGGAQDKEAAALKEARPANGTINFREQKIELTFNEFIQNSGFPTTVISPPLDKKPAYGMVGKTLIIRFKSELRDSTTYTINFGDDIKDLNESNVTSNFTYVFSTGSYIDSQSISGVITNAKDGKAADGALVLLYPRKVLQSDSVKEPVLNVQPSYFAKTDANGKYEIRNVKADYYKVYTLKDGNFNYLYDQPNELIGFTDSLINMTDTVPAQNDMLIYIEEGKAVELQNVKSMEAGRLQIQYNGPVRRFKIEADSLQNDFIYWKNAARDSLTIWYSDFYARGASIYTTANDTVLDTTRIELKFIDKDTMLTAQKYPLSIVNQVVETSQRGQIKDLPNIQSLYGWLKINFNRPIIGIDSSKRIEILEDSTTNVLQPQVQVAKYIKQQLEFSFDRKPGTAYSLIVPDSTFRDIFGIWNKAINWKFKTNTKESYGNIKLKVSSNGTANYILNILNDKNELIEEVHVNSEKEKLLTISNIPAGPYHITVVNDVNNNGEWDTGNLMRHVQPETVKLLPDTYTLKGGWDLDVEVKL